MQAAREEAQLRLAERIAALRLAEGRTVGDLAGPGRPLESSLRGYLAALRPAAPTGPRPDGSYELTLEADLTALGRHLGEALRRQGGPSPAGAEGLARLVQINGIQAVRHTGRFRPSDAARPARTTSPGLAWQEGATPRGRESALQAARLDATRKLTAQALALPIAADVRLGDLARESAPVAAAVEAHLAAVAPKSVLYHTDELIVDVMVEAPVRSLLQAARQAFQTHYQGNRASIGDFDQALAHTGQRVLQATGSGVVPELHLRGRPGGIPAPLTRPDWPATLQATGEATLRPADRNPAQARLIATRQAEQQARQHLAEQARDLRITPQTSVGDLVGRYPRIGADLESLWQQARLSDTAADATTARATVTLETEPLWRLVTQWIRQHKLSVP